MSEYQRFIEITDAPADIREDHAVKILRSNQQTILYFTTAELNDLINKGVQRLYETEQLLWH